MTTKKKTTKPKPPSCQEYEKFVKEVYAPWYNKYGNVSPSADSGGTPSPPPPPPPGGGGQ